MDVLIEDMYTSVNTVGGNQAITQTGCVINVNIVCTRYIHLYNNGPEGPIANLENSGALQ